MNKKIRITANGPYEVTGGIPLVGAAYIPYDEDKGASESWKEVKRYNTDGKPYLLCRCGHSGSKPFCDSTHYVEGFSGEEIADRTPYDESAKIYETPAYTLMDREDLCEVAHFFDPGMTACYFPF